MKLNFIGVAAVLCCCLFCVSIQECRYDQSNYFNRVALCTNVTNLTAELIAINYYMILVRVEINNSNLSTIDQNFIVNYNINDLEITNSIIDNIKANAFTKNHIRNLLIEGCKIGHMDPLAFNSTTLDWLSFRNNSLYSIKSEIFSEMTPLNSLYLSYNNIGHIEGYANFSSLSKLDLSHNYNLPSTFLNNLINMTNLKELNVGWCSLSSSSLAGFSKLKSLEKIDISGNKLFTLNGDDFPPSLMYMNASHNFPLFLSLRGSWQHLQKLSTLDLSYSNLWTEENLNNSFDDCISLTTLKLNNNNLNELFFKTKLKKLYKLIVLKLDDNLLTKLDCETFANNTQLQEISVTMNEIDSIINIEKCPKSLQRFNISNNQLIGSVNSFSELSNLRELDLSNNELETLDYNSFGNLKKLNWLYLNHNKFNSWPIGTFRDLIELKTLHLQHNFISNLTHGSFSGLHNLYTLNMSYNELKEIDEEVFSSLKSLASFDVSWNKLDNFDVAKALSHIKKTIRVDLDGNKYSCSILAKISKSSEIVYGNTFDEYNVNGVRCDHEDRTASNDKSLPDLIKSISWNLCFNTAMLILLIVVVISYIGLKCIRKYFGDSSTNIVRFRKEDNRPIQLDF